MSVLKISNEAIACCLLESEYAANEESIRKSVRLIQAMIARIHVLGERQEEISESMSVLKRERR